ncbi:hypothetical protein BDW72DRAFT_152451 [Aspergillus terricola var. indicus]
MCDLGDLDALEPERYIAPKRSETVSRNKSLNQAIADTILVAWKVRVERTVTFGHVHDMSSTARKFHVYFLPASQSMFERCNPDYNSGGNDTEAKTPEGRKEVVFGEVGISGPCILRLSIQLVKRMTWARHQVLFVQSPLSGRNKLNGPQ